MAVGKEVTEVEIIERLEKRGLVGARCYGPYFYVEGITVLGRKIKKGCSSLEFCDRFESEVLKNVFCPVCNAQSYRTDQQGIATCGNAPGFFFFYEEDKDEEEHEEEVELKLVNGQYVKVPKLKEGKKRK